MKKVESFTSIKGEFYTWSDLENWYIDEINKEGSNGYQTPLMRLNNVLSEQTDGRRIRLINFLIDNFDDIVSLKPQNQLRLIKFFDRTGYNSMLYDYTNSKQTHFGEKITWAFRYKDFRGEKLILLAEKQNIKTCLYCNSQYTLTVEHKKDKAALFQFDHFFPKSKYPYFSISLYNLIPSCPSCNLNKSATCYDLKDFVHPYMEDFHNKFIFKIPDIGHIQLLQGITPDKRHLKPSIYPPNSTRVKNYNKEFRLTGIYRRHTDIVEEVYKSAYAYKNKGKEALLDLVNENGRKIFNSKEEIERLLLKNFTLEEDINKRPLSKFMQDMAKQSGLIER